MAILGYNTKGTTSGALAVGLKAASKFTLPTAGTLNELHAWVGGTGGDLIVFCYADSSGTPGALLAYTSPIAFGPGDKDASQTGFSVSLPAADYWLGFVANASGGPVVYRENTGGTHIVIASGATYNPPSNPWTGGGTTGTRKYSVWAVVGAAGGAFVPQIVIT